MHANEPSLHQLNIGREILSWRVTCSVWLIKAGSIAPFWSGGGGGGGSFSKELIFIYKHSIVCVLTLNTLGSLFC